MEFWIECLECRLIFKHAENTPIWCPRCDIRHFRFCDFNEV